MKEFCMHEIKKEMRYEKLMPGFSIPLQTSFDESRTQKKEDGTPLVSLLVVTEVFMYTCFAK